MVSVLNSWPCPVTVTHKCSATKCRLSSLKEDMSIGHLKTSTEHLKDPLIQYLVSIREKEERMLSFPSWGKDEEKR